MTNRGFTYVFDFVLMIGNCSN